MLLMKTNWLNFQLRWKPEQVRPMCICGPQLSFILNTDWASSSLLCLRWQFEKGFSPRFVWRSRILKRSMQAFRWIATHITQRMWISCGSLQPLNTYKFLWWTSRRSIRTQISSRKKRMDWTGVHQLSSSRQSGLWWLWMSHRNWVQSFKRQQSRNWIHYSNCAIRQHTVNIIIVCIALIP